MAATIVEIAPGIAINQVADAALKSASYSRADVVERSFGVLEFHSKTQADVKHAAKPLCRALGRRWNRESSPRS